MEPPHVTGPTGPPERNSGAPFVVAAALAFFVPWTTAFLVPWATWSIPLLPLAAWLTIGTSGGALVIGGRDRKIGKALIAGEVLGAFLFLMSLVFAFAVPVG